MNTREELLPYLRQYRHNDRSDGFIAAYDIDGIEAHLKKTAAKYELRIKELEEALLHIRNRAHQTHELSGGLIQSEMAYLISEADLALHTTSPDKALQRDRLNTRIEEHENVSGLHQQMKRLEQLRDELAALERSETLEGEKI